MVQLGTGFAAAVEKASSQGDLAGMFDAAFQAMADELYRKLRADLLDEIRVEVQRAGASFPDIVAAIERIAIPTVTVEAAQAPNVTVMPADVTVNVPKPSVVVERPKKQRIITDAEGHPTGIESVQ